MKARRRNVHRSIGLLVTRPTNVLVIQASAIGTNISPKSQRLRATALEWS